jgi:mono/diheme cytochrome c family protein
VEVAAGTVTATVLLDNPDLGAANPWGVACSADGALLAIAHAGTHEVSLIDRPGLLRKIATARSAEALSYDLSFLGELRRRVRLPGQGPRGIALGRDRAYAAQYFSDSVAAVPLAPGGTVQDWPMGPRRPATAVRQGEMAFHDATRCFQQWQSCVSCHPGSRVDGLNWDLLNDGMGNPKNARSMLYAHRNPPAMSLGVRASAEVAVRAGFRFIQNTVVDETVASAVDEYLKSLTPVPSPHLVDGRLSPRQEQGRALFEKADCITCHKPPLYADGKLHDLGTAQGMDKGRKVKTPTLIEVWRTAPYLHDGRAATLREVFAPANNPDQAHGEAHRLSPEELDALIDYVQTL